MRELTFVFTSAEASELLSQHVGHSVVLSQQAMGPIEERLLSSLQAKEQRGGAMIVIFAGVNGAGSVRGPGGFNGGAPRTRRGDYVEAGSARPWASAEPVRRASAKGRAVDDPVLLATLREQAHKVADLAFGPLEESYPGIKYPRNSRISESPKATAMQKLIEQNLEQARQLTSIRKLARDVETNLTSIMGFSDLIMYSPTDHSGVQKYIRRIKFAGRRAREIAAKIIAACREGEGPLGGRSNGRIVDRVV